MGKILIVYTGGTIGCEMQQNGLGPMPANKFYDELKTLQRQPNSLMPSFDYIGFESALDSSQIDINGFNNINKIICDNYLKYDGFVVLTGTDTMSSIAAFSAFGLGNTDKTVVFTGSIRGWDEQGTDAQVNIYKACAVAGSDIGGAVLVFGQQIMRAANSYKQSNHAFEAFRSRDDNAHSNSEKTALSKVINGVRPQIFNYVSTCVPIVPIVPKGTGNELFAAALQTNPNAIIIQPFGTGTIPNEPCIIAALSMAKQNGIPVIAIPATMDGGLDFDRYATGGLLTRYGVINGGPLTPATAHAKVNFLLSSGIGIGPGMAKSFVGELPVTSFGTQVSPQGPTFQP